MRASSAKIFIDESVRVDRRVIRIGNAMESSTAAAVWT
jgi:hypothetical protein